MKYSELVELKECISTCVSREMEAVRDHIQRLDRTVDFMSDQVSRLLQAQDKPKPGHHHYREGDDVRHTSLFHHRRKDD